MRLFAVKCIILACIVTTLAAEQDEKTRSKRDLQFLKEVIAAKLGLTPPKPVQKEENVNILRIPNFDQIVVNALPKLTVVEVPTPERIVQVDPTTVLIGSYLGTKTPEETMFALQGMKRLIQMGMLSPKQEVIELAPPKSPVYVLSSPVGEQKLKYTEARPYPIFKETVIPMPPPVITQIQSLTIPYSQDRVIPAPPKIVAPEIKTVSLTPPVSIPFSPVISVPVVPTRYSYQQVEADGSVTSYLSEEGNQEVVITGTKIPPPPPPAFIIDRLQKIVYGKPLGSPVPKPTFGDVVVGPYYPEPLLPIITEPSSVDVKVKHSDKTDTGRNTKTHPVENTIAVNIPVTPLDIPSPPELPTTESGAQDKYKHVHADGSVSTYSGTLSPGESYEVVSNSEEISRLPPPPPELLSRIKSAAGKARKPGRYSLQMSNGVGTYESINGGKIYYSHLENPAESDVLPDPLSLPNSNKAQTPNKNVFVVGYEDSELDEYGKPYLSTKINNESNNDAQPNFEPIKKIPPLPMPITGENQNNIHPHTFGAAKYSYKIVSDPVNYQGFGTDGFSYTQVNHDGTVETFTGTEKLSRPFEEKFKKIPSLPLPVFKTSLPTKQPSSTINIGEGSGFSYTQFNKGDVIKTISEGKHVTTPAHALEAPLHPVAIVDVLQPASKGPCKTNKKCKKPVSSGFSYALMDNGGRVTKITGDNQVNKLATIKVPVVQPAVVDVIQPYQRPPPVAIEFGDNSSGAIMFKKPAVSNYIYRQISHTNPQPFTVVKIEDKPIVTVPAGDVHVKVNPHKHVRPDGTTYLCTEFHKVAPDAPIPPLPTDKVVATVPDNLIYIPPLNVNVPHPTLHKVEVMESGSHFSYTQTSSSSSTEASSNRSTTEATTETISSDEPISFELNPIVVAPENTKYSYTQKNSDGSSLNIEGARDKHNTVSVTLGDSDIKSADSVTVEDSEVKSLDSTRGDIPLPSK